MPAGLGGPWQELLHLRGSLLRLPTPGGPYVGIPLPPPAPAIFQPYLRHKGALALHSLSVLLCKLSPSLGGGQREFMFGSPIPGTLPISSWKPP